PLQRFPDVLDYLQKPRSISKLMREVYGCDHIRRNTYVSTRTVRAQDAKLLKIPLNQPILLVQAINVDQNDQVIEYTVSRFRGDGVELTFSH
ncbi:MAG: UTRA domain-containing protein, partial [Cyanobacteria bacterium J06559_3]